MLQSKSLVARRLILASLTVGASVVGVWGLLTHPVFAATSSCGGVETSIISGDFCAGASKDSNDSANNPILSVLTFVMQLLTGAVGIAAVGALIYAGILYSAAGGEAGQVQKAKTLIKDTVIGIVCYAGMILILNFVIPGGVFGQQSTVGGGTAASPGGGGSGASQGGDLAIATFNIRTTSGDAWSSARSNAILSYIKTVDITGIQEGTNESTGWLKTRLTSAGYANALYKTGEYRGLFWKTSKFTVVNQGVRSLPYSRNLVWAKLKMTSTGTVFYALDVHLKVWGTSPTKWDTGVTSPYRISEIKEILSFVKSSIPSDAPIVFVGDMNSHIGSAEDKLIQSGGFKDSYSVAATKKNLDYSSASKPIMGSAHKSGGGPIDHIYVRGGITVSRVEVMIHQAGSDHVPVEADISLPGTSSSGGGTPSASTAPKLSSNIGNFRDAGTSGYVKTGVLFRSANLNAATPSDKLVLSGLLKGGKVIDLRLSGDTGFSADVDKSLTGVNYVHVGIKGEATAAGYKKTFINDANMRKQFGKALTEIANASGPLLVHCKAGKDRTGWTVALAMMAVGVSKSSALDEYNNSPDVQDSWFNAAYTEATNKAHTGGSGKILDFITRDVSQGGLGVSQSTIDTLITKLRK